jgi:hypothetical protein
MSTEDIKRHKGVVLVTVALAVVLCVGLINYWRFPIKPPPVILDTKGILETRQYPPSLMYVWCLQEPTGLQILTGKLWYLAKNGVFLSSLSSYGNFFVGDEVSAIGRGSSVIGTDGLAYWVFNLTSLVKLNSPPSTKGTLDVQCYLDGLKVIPDNKEIFINNVVYSTDDFGHWRGDLDPGTYIVRAYHNQEEHAVAKGVYVGSITYVELIWTTPQGTEIWINSVKDAEVSQSQPELNYGNAAIAYVMSGPGTGINHYAYFEFPLSSVPSDSLLVAARVYWMLGDTIKYPKNHVYSRVVGVWDESTVKWNNKPDVTTQNQLTVAVPNVDGGGRFDVDVLPLVKDAFALGVSLSFRAKTEVDDDPQGSNMFYVCREGPAHGYMADWAPRLKITYKAPGPPPTYYHLDIYVASTGGTTNPAPGYYTYPEGTVISVTALPANGYEFYYWLFDDAGNIQNPIQITMSKDHTLEGCFKTITQPTSQIAAMTPKEPYWDYIANSGGQIGRIDIYHSIAYNHYDGGYGCASLNASQGGPVKVEIDTASFQLWTGSFWINVEGVESYFVSDVTLSETWAVPQGVWVVSFDCTIVAGSALRGTSGIVKIYVKDSANNIIGTFIVNYVVPSG